MKVSRTITLFLHVHKCAGPFFLWLDASRIRMFLKITELPCAPLQNSVQVLSKRSAESQIILHYYIGNGLQQFRVICSRILAIRLLQTNSWFIPQMLCKGLRTRDHQTRRTSGTHVTQLLVTRLGLLASICQSTTRYQVISRLKCFKSVWGTAVKGKDS